MINSKFWWDPCLQLNESCLSKVDVSFVFGKSIPSSILAKGEFCPQSLCLRRISKIRKGFSYLKLKFVGVTFRPNGCARQTFVVLDDHQGVPKWLRQGPGPRRRTKTVSEINPPSTPMFQGIRASPRFSTTRIVVGLRAGVQKDLWRNSLHCLGSHQVHPGGYFLLSFPVHSLSTGVWTYTWVGKVIGVTGIETVPTRTIFRDPIGLPHTKWDFIFTVPSKKNSASEWDSMSDLMSSH